MGYELKHIRANIAGRFDCSIDTWPMLLDLAEKYGWEPMGTTAELGLVGQPDHDPADWSGTYFSNETQVVKEEDARNMATALHKALQDLENGKDRREVGYRGAKARLREFIEF